MDWPYSSHTNDISSTCVHVHWQLWVQRRIFFPNRFLFFCIRPSEFIWHLSSLSFPSTRVRRPHCAMVSIISFLLPFSLVDIVLKVMTFLMTSLNVLTLSGFRETLLRVETLFLYTIHAFLIHYNIHPHSLCSLNLSLLWFCILTTTLLVCLIYRCSIIDTMKICPLTAVASWRIYFRKVIISHLFPLAESMSPIIPSWQKKRIPQS